MQSGVQEGRSGGLVGWIQDGASGGVQGGAPRGGLRVGHREGGTRGPSRGGLKGLKGGRGSDADTSHQPAAAATSWPPPPVYPIAPHPPLQESSPDLVAAQKSIENAYGLYIRTRPTGKEKEWGPSVSLIKIVG